MTIAGKTHRVVPAIGWTLAAIIPVAFLTLFFVWPVVALIVTGFVDDGRLALDAVGDVLRDPRTQQVTGQTLAQAGSATLCSVVLGLPAAFVLYRLNFPGRGMLTAVFTVPFVLPTVVVGIAFTALLGPGGPLEWLGLDRTFSSVVIGLTFFNVAVVARIVGGFWSQLDSRPAQAARTLGAGPLRVWCTITLPALMPAIAAAAALIFLFCATSFGTVLILGGREFSNIETEIYRLTVQFLDLRSAAVLSIVQFVIVALVVSISGVLRRRSERTVNMRAERRSPMRGDLPVIAVFVATLVILYLIPIVTLVARSLTGHAGAFSLEHYAALFATDGDGPVEGSAFDAILLSLGSATIATVLAMVLGLLVVFVASRRPRSVLLRRGIGLFDGFVMLPIGVSAVTLGFGLLVTMHRPLGLGFDLRTSVVLIPIAQALVALPLVVRMLVPVLRGIDPKLRDAAAMLGASPGRVLASIDLPMLGRSAGLALGFALATSLGEFGATAFLVRPGEKTLPVIIAELIGQPGAGSYGTALAGAVVLGVMTGAIMLAAERLRIGTNVGEW